MQKSTKQLKIHKCSLFYGSFSKTFPLSKIQRILESAIFVTKYLCYESLLPLVEVFYKFNTKYSTVLHSSFTLYFMLERYILKIFLKVKDIYMLKWLIYNYDFVGFIVQRYYLQLAIIKLLGTMWVSNSN